MKEMGKSRIIEVLSLILAIMSVISGIYFSIKSVQLTQREADIASSSLELTGEADVIAASSSAQSQNDFIQLLPLEQANVIFPESGIQVETSTDGTDELIIPYIENDGKASARNVSFRIYVAAIDNSIPVQDAFNGEVVEDLQPGESIKFGSIRISPYGNFPQTLQIALIMHLSYFDTLTGITQNKIYMFQEPIAEGIIAALLEADYKSIYSQLLSGISTSSDPYLHQYLINNPPIN